MLKATKRNEFHQLSRDDSKQLLHEVWQDCRGKQWNKCQELFEIIKLIRAAGWEVYWNNFNEPYMP